MTSTILGLRIFIEWVAVFFVIYMIVYSVFMFMAVVSGSITMYKDYRKDRLKNVLNRDFYIPISIIVPAYNEEVTIVSTIKSLLALEYKSYEIIVVDDGSKDSTSEQVINAFNMHQIRMPIRQQIKCQRTEFVYVTTDEKVQVKLIRKVNGGKADALNMGINASSFPYFLCIDADSVLQYDSLQKIAKPVLEDDRIVAVGGCVRPCNGLKFTNNRVEEYHLPNNIIACMQVLEYDRSFLAARILFDKFNGSLIISGAFGLFKKDVVIGAGGYDSTTMGEDMELCVKLHDYCLSNDVPYRIKYATDAICWTQVPESLKDLTKQRRRWHIGLFDSMRKHKQMLAGRRYGLVGIISYIYFLVYELLSPYIEVFGILTMVLAFVIELINLPFMILFMLIYAVFGCVISLTAFFARVYTIELKIKPLDVLKVLLLCLFELTALRFVLAWVRAVALLSYKKKKHNWGRIERKKINY